MQFYWAWEHTLCQKFSHSFCASRGKWKERERWELEEEEEKSEKISQMYCASFRAMSRRWQQQQEQQQQQQLLQIRTDSFLLLYKPKS